MARPNKIWFRKDIGWWMVTLSGEKIRLAEGRGNKRRAEQKFHELAAVRTCAPEGASARVADVIEAFLAWSKIHLSEETNRNSIWYGQMFSEHCGYLSAAEACQQIGPSPRESLEHGATSQTSALPDRNY